MTIKLAKDIKKLEFIVSFFTMNDKLWQGYSEDSCEKAIKKGFVRLYEAYGRLDGCKFTYKKTNYTDIPVCSNMRFKPNPKFKEVQTYNPEDIF